MATIRISVDAETPCSVFEIEGDVTAREIVAAMDGQYPGPTPVHALWDYTNATFSNLSTADYRRIALAAKGHAPDRTGGRTALVAPGEIETIAIRLFEAIAEVVGLPIHVRRFATREEAFAWLRDGTGKQDAL